MSAGILVAMAVVMFSSCRHTQDLKNVEQTVLMAYGDSVLTEEEVIERIPAGLQEADSIEMFNRIADSWAEDMVLSGMAEENSQHLDRIDRLVADYRNRLIVAEYLKNMVSTGSVDVTEGDVRKYYEKNRSRMVLDEPLVKGIYIKMPSSSGKISDVRRLMAKGTESAVDNIESYCLDEAAQYEYFGNRWIEWSGISEQIPYRFSDPDAFLSSNRDFETEYGDSRYFLHIIEYIPSGSEMPYQYASSKIREIIGKENSDRIRRELLNDIYRYARKDGRLRTYGYEPGFGRILNKER